MQQRFYSFPHRRALGFTLVELILVLVLVGIIAALSADLITKPFQAFVDQKNRAALTAEADIALTRMVREWRISLPNSVRVSDDGQFIEFIPTIAGGRYRAVADAPGQSAVCFDNPPATADCSRFDVLGDLNARQDPSGGDRVVIFNASASGCNSPAANAYCDVAENNWANMTSADDDAVVLSGTHAFPFRSGSAQRFYITPESGPVTFYCADGNLYRVDGYGYQADQPTTGLSGNNPRLLSANVQGCNFTYQPGTHSRSAVVSAELTLEKNNEAVSLLYQTQVLNTP